MYVYTSCARYIHVYLYSCMYVSAHVSNDIAHWLPIHWLLTLDYCLLLVGHDMCF